MQRYWENILRKANAISDAPPEWEADLFYEQDTKADDRTYCKRGGFLGKLAQFDPFSFGIMPNAVDGGEPDHYMALQAAHDALKDCGKLNLESVKDRTAVILGRGTYVNRGNAAALQQGAMVDSVLRVLKQLHPEHTDEELAEVKRQLRASLPPFHADTASGLVPNIITGRIANRLDLMGPNYLIDAACASSLVAVEMAARELETGRCDLALAGGVNSNTSPVLMMIFSQLGALSRRGQLSSFDKDADGTLLGEGVGMVVLKRLEDAERDGNHVYAVLKNIGIASDGRATGVLAPRVEGEETALRRAYEPEHIDPLTVGLLEAHGTGTPVGDVVEVEALRRVFPPRSTESPRCALGSVKSMISHTVPAAGVAGLIKAALALHHKVLPPTICANPNPKLQLENTNFYINTETRPWIHGSSKTPRRAGVNAFGFGGINAHAILEEYTGPHAAPWLQHQWDSELFVFSGQNRAEVLADAQQTLDLVQSSGDDLSLKNLAWTLNCNRPMGPVRMAVVGTSHADLQAKLERAIKRLGDERTRNIKEIEGIYQFREPLGQQGKLAFLFPGEGSQYRNMLGDLCIHFPEVRRTFDLMDRAYENHPRDYLPSDVIFPPPLGSPSQERLYNMDSGAETVFCANQALYALIENLGIRPDAMVGHSTGEHSALLASRVVDVHGDEELIRHILGVYEVFDKLNSTSDIPEAVLLAVAGADHAFLEQQVAKSEGELYIALDNCIHQVVVCGREEVVDKLIPVLTPKGAICQKLPFSRAYHTPWFEVFSKPLKQHFDRLRIGQSPGSALFVRDRRTVSAGSRRDPLSGCRAMVEHRALPRDDRRHVSRRRAPLRRDRSAQQSDRLHRRCTALQIACGHPVQRATPFGHFAASPHAGSVSGARRVCQARASLRAARSPANNRKDQAKTNAGPGHRSAAAAPAKRFLTAEESLTQIGTVPHPDSTTHNLQPTTHPRRSAPTADAGTSQHHGAVGENAAGSHGRLSGSAAGYTAGQHAGAPFSLLPRCSRGRARACVLWRGTASPPNGKESFTITPWAAMSRPKIPRCSA